MSLKIISQKQEPLLSRTNVKAELTFEQATPSTADVAKQIASAVKKDEKLVVVRKINTHYGSRQADVDAVVYDSEKAKEQVETKPKKQKEAAEKKEAPAEKKEVVEKKEAPAEKKEVPKEEKPAEEKKEESKEEKPKEKKEAPKEEPKKE